MDKVNLLKTLGKTMGDAPEAIPDIDQLLDHVIGMLEYINTDEMKQLEDSDPYAFEQHLDTKFSDFTYRYYAVFKLLLDKENRKDNVARLIQLFEKLNKIKNNETSIDDAYEEYTEGLNSRYIYSKFGGKAKFEQKMKENRKE